MFEQIYRVMNRCVHKFAKDLESLSIIHARKLFVDYSYTVCIQYMIKKISFVQKYSITVYVFGSSIYPYISFQQ